jgi:predicted carbohydrate-binding protein with CBM5 and CBM33 domain
LLDEDNEQNTSLLGLTDQNRAHGPVHHPTSRRAGLRTQKRPLRMRLRASSGSTRPSSGPT